MPPQKLNGALPIEARTAGALTWKDVLVGTDGKPAPTVERVWTAPRKVQSAMITSAEGKSEKFLFYRGVANLVAPLMVTREGDQLHIKTDPSIHGRDEMCPSTADMYLVEIRKDGTCAFRQFPTLATDESEADLRTPSTFKESDFTSDSQLLREAMHESLTRAGLKSDEASAMLSTWEQSYFKSAGLRLFFLVPRAWTDAVLPITISRPAEITRVMVGRIEIVSPQQREAITRIASAPAANDPAAFASYESLGRFRDALLLDAARVNPAPMLTQFMQARGIQFAPQHTAATAPSASAAPVH
jgi:hypothetical protein